MVLNDFKSKIFLAESTGTGLFKTNNSKLKILTPKQMLQRFPIALAQVKAGNNSEDLLNKIIHCFNQKKLLKRYIAI